MTMVFPLSLISLSLHHGTIMGLKKATPAARSVVRGMVSKCDETTGHINGLNLRDSCLYGYFPQNSSLFKLTHLGYPNLRGNNFKPSGIPHNFGQLSSLINLDLSMSRFSGQILLEISRLSNLRKLDLYYSSGSRSYDADKLLKLHNPDLDTLLNNLTCLSTLALDLVHISSTITPILSNLTSWKWLSLASTHLSGEFPSSIFHLPHLEYIDISNNYRLAGVLPEFQRNGSSYKLRLLSISKTRFLGKLPYSLGDCFTNLRYLGLHSTRLTGEVPSSFVNLTRLDFLAITNTTFTITPAFFNVLSKLNNLRYLEMDSLHFPEPTTFPPLSNLTKLTLLSARSCHLMGSVPSWLPNLSQLQQIFLSDNNLKNVSVSSFLKLKRLKYLALDGMSLIFPRINAMHNDIISSNIPQLHYLSVCNCNIKEYPEFLKYQHELRYFYISQNRIHGLIPHWLGNTFKETLQFVSMDGNSLTGFEQSDPSVIIPWINIMRLDLAKNRVQGRVLIPPTSLKVYTLRNNSLTGNISELICYSTLTFLDLSYNNLSGQIPKCFDKLGDSLVVLNLQANMMQGVIPQKFGMSCRLEALNLSENRLEGKLPKSLANGSTLRLLDTGNNATNDTFPSWMGNLQRLQILILRHNHFHGMVQGNIHRKSNIDFLNLRVLDLSNNFLTGCLPIGYWPSMRSLGQDMHYVDLYDYIVIRYRGFKYYYNYVNEFRTINKGADTTYLENLRILKVIDLSSNNFAGNIPYSIGNLTGLVGLNISNNDLTGEIPSSLKNITTLEWLDLSHNKLYGMIPDEPMSLTFLQIFNVSYNHLIGPVPHGKQFDTFDNSSFEGNPGLCGKPLIKRCKDSNDLPLPPPPSTQDDFDWMDWTIRLLGYGSGLVVGIVGGMIFGNKHHEWFMALLGSRSGRGG